MLERFIQFAATPWGSFAVLIVAGSLEVLGDKAFNSGIHDYSGAKRIALFVVGTLVLALYSIFLNWSNVDFGKLLGIYVAVFFVVAQIVAMKPLTRPICVGGTLVVVGGLIMRFWKR